jgi:hypothetical protein
VIGTAAGDLQSSLAGAARAMVESGAETGLQIAVLHRGRLVADVAVGAAMRIGQLAASVF